MRCKWELNLALLCLNGIADWVQLWQALQSLTIVSGCSNESCILFGCLTPLAGFAGSFSSSQIAVVFDWIGEDPKSATHSGCRTRVPSLSSSDSHALSCVSPEAVLFKKFIYEARQLTVSSSKKHDSKVKWPDSSVLQSLSQYYLILSSKPGNSRKFRDKFFPDSWETSCCHILIECWEMHDGIRRLLKNIDYTKKNL